MDHRGQETLDGRYRLAEVIGEGGSAVVHVATDLQTGRQVAIKRVTRGDLALHELRARLARELRLIARLRHPNLVRVFDHGVDAAGTPFVVLELLHGVSLRRLLQQRGAIGVGEALRLLLPVLGALSHAHDEGVVHRDLKPDNIFLSRAPDGRIVPKLLDFGVAVATGGERLTRGGVVVGTAAYLAPELALGEGATVQTDVWACGVVVYRCLSGKLPYAAPDLHTLLQRIAREPRPPLASCTGGVHPRIAAVVDRALERNLARRFESVRCFAHALHVTARDQGIALPQAPDPLGLSDWPRWAEEPGDRTVELVLPVG